MPNGHLIAATVMTLGVCKGHLSIASFLMLTSASRGPSAIAELLVNFGGPIHISGMAQAIELSNFVQRETISSLAKGMTNHPYGPIPICSRDPFLFAQLWT